MGDCMQCGEERCTPQQKVLPNFVCAMLGNPALIESKSPDIITGKGTGDDKRYHCRVDKRHAGGAFRHTRSGFDTNHCFTGA